MRYWTADCHFGHANILKYCKRPYRDTNHMNQSMVYNANARVNDTDDVVHVGDFCIRSKDSKFKWWREKLAGNWVFLEGNHDKTSGVKSIGSSMFARVGEHTVFVSHVPFFYDSWFDIALRQYVTKTCAFAVCGHIHTEWGYSLDGGIPTINVGVDAQNFFPITDSELLGQYQKILKREIPPVQEVVINGG
jgi:calcineurin-like phosphoesterase family protein